MPYNLAITDAQPGVFGEQEIQMILRVLGVSLIGLTLAGCVNNDSFWRRL
jgi:hypothetical protein